MQSKSHRVFIIGSKGLLGTPTAARFAGDAEIDVLALDLPDVDITDADQVGAKLDDSKPELVINCAAYTAVDACEENEETARRVNGIGAGIVAKAAADRGARMIHISTDYVFDGDATAPYPEDHPTGPPEKLSAYGRSKLLGEQEVRKHHAGALIVRTAWLYGPDGPGFPRAILRRAREAGELRVVNDQTGSPTFAPDLADALYKLAHIHRGTVVEGAKTQSGRPRHGIGGIVHVTNSGCCTWYEFASEILRLAAIDVPVTPVTTAQFPRPAKRPAFSVLDNRRYVAAVGEPLRSWREAIGEYVKTHVPAAGR